MQPEDARAELTRAWLRKARADLETARRAAVPPPLLDAAVFHCQQASEKALKAFLVWHDQPFRRTHDLEELLRQCAESEATFMTQLEAAERLSLYAVEPRYPGLFEPTDDEMTEALRLSEELVAFVVARLPDAVLREDKSLW